ncbi:hypothetical protein GDO81_027044 [Engystomops pustulosus]|uniref:Uncharacterized protein n=1 Tax=Engystomops pustulosus TaxID=76066 RepID=A0AAV6YME2_ENGPU|nr:hypothetical protein GDO81_027044 [Engystomops pustulosus]
MITGHGMVERICGPCKESFIFSPSFLISKAVRTVLMSTGTAEDFNCSKIIRGSILWPCARGEGEINVLCSLPDSVTPQMSRILELYCIFDPTASVFCKFWIVLTFRRI